MPMNETEVISGDARVTRDGDIWRIGNGEIDIEIAAPEGAPATLRTLSLATGQSWSVTEALSPYSITLNDSNVTPDLAVAAARAWDDGGVARLEIDMRSPAGHRVLLHMECHSGQAMVRQWLEIEATSPLRVTDIEPLRLGFATGDVDTVYTVSGVQRQGGWRADEGPYRSFRLESHPFEGSARHHSGPRSTWDETPWCAIAGREPGGIIAALEYGGQWERRLDADETRSIAFATDGIQPQIVPGTRWISPAAWLGAFTGDLDSAAAVMHRYIRSTVLPQVAADFPWVQYNTWFSWYCELDEATLLEEATIASDLGMEVFYVDAGWWIGNPVRRDHFSSGLGNWRENREKFPRGLRAFADDIRKRGMHFGIWVEPERVDLRTATTGTWKPEWIARGADGRYIRCDWPADTDTAWLCFGHPETQAWAEEWIGNLVEELGVRWLKWDSNYWGICTSNDHGHGESDGERSQVEGVYAVMARLRARFPDLVIENCAGGATRMDFAITRHTHAAWLNDASEPAHRSRFHNAGASYLFPPAMLNAWVTESNHENVNGQDLPAPVWRSIIRSRMLGAMGFSCRLGTWSDATRDVAREEIARYQREIRPLFQAGTFHHLLPQPVIPSRDLPTPDVWEAYQFSAADGGTHAILAFRNASPDDAVTLPIAIPEGAYIVDVEGEVASRRSGRQLRDEGLTVVAPLLSSCWISIRRADEDAVSS